MKKIILASMCLGLLINLNANSFQNKYYKCTLIEEQLQKISQRRAEALDKANLSLIIKESKLEFNGLTRQYIRTGKSEGVMVDVYGNEYSSSNFNNIFLNKNNRQLYELERMNNYNSVVIYSCREATFFEKAIMIKNSFGN